MLFAALPAVLRVGCCAWVGWPEYAMPVRGLAVPFRSFDYTVNR